MNQVDLAQLPVLPVLPRTSHVVKMFGTIAVWLFGLYLVMNGLPDLSEHVVFGLIQVVAGYMITYQSVHVMD